eukprot:13565240-Heterocapsa_arctica.AAC.1
MAASSTRCKPCTVCSIRWPGILQPTRAAVLPPSAYRQHTEHRRSPQDQPMWPAPRTSRPSAIPWCARRPGGQGGKADPLRQSRCNS